jgi:hypothetical protein
MRCLPGEVREEGHLCSTGPPPVLDMAEEEEEEEESRKQSCS